MYQDLADIKVLTYDILNKSMDDCQGNIETVSNDIQHLQASFEDEEAKLEDENFDLNKIDMKQGDGDVKRGKNKEQRENVLGELVITEREYCRDLKLTWQVE